MSTHGMDCSYVWPGLPEPPFIRIFNLPTLALNTNLKQFKKTVI
jgi:hypothetical protein